MQEPAGTQSGWHLESSIQYPATESYSNLGHTCPCCTNHLQNPRRHPQRQSSSNYACTWTNPQVSSPLLLQRGFSGPKTTRGLAVTAGGSPAAQVDQQVTDAKDKIQHFQTFHEPNRAAVPDQGQPLDSPGLLAGLLPWAAGIFPLFSCLRRFWWDLPL